LCPSGLFRRRRGVAGFTLIEVLVALVVIGVSLSAIGSLVAATVRGIRSIDQHLALVETSRAIEIGLPDRNSLTVGSYTGEMGGHRWRVDVSPLRTDIVDSRLPTPWVPLAVIIVVQSPAGSILRINTVRLRRRTDG
jgi:general secretion pathway protein I